MAKGEDTSSRAAPDHRVPQAKAASAGTQVCFKGWLATALKWPRASGVSRPRSVVLRHELQPYIMTTALRASRDVLSTTVGSLYARAMQPGRWSARPRLPPVPRDSDVWIKKNAFTFAITGDRHTENASSTCNRADHRSSSPHRCHIGARTGAHPCYIRVCARRRVCECERVCVRASVCVCECECE